MQLYEKFLKDKAILTELEKIKVETVFPSTRTGEPITLKDHRFISNNNLLTTAITLQGISTFRKISFAGYVNELSNGEILKVLKTMSNASSSDTYFPHLIHDVYTLNDELYNGEEFNRLLNLIHASNFNDFMQVLYGKDFEVQSLIVNLYLHSLEEFYCHEGPKQLGFTPTLSNIYYFGGGYNVTGNVNIFNNFLKNDTLNSLKILEGRGASSGSQVLHFFKSGYSPEFYYNFMEYCYSIKDKFPTYYYHHQLQNNSHNINIPVNSIFNEQENSPTGKIYTINREEFLKNYDHLMPMAWNVELFMRELEKNR